MNEFYLTNKKDLALVLLVKEQFNVLRAKLGLPPITNDQIKTAFRVKLNSLGHVSGKNPDMQMNEKGHPKL